MQQKLSTIYARIDKVLTDKGLVKSDGSPNYAKAERICGIKGTVLSKVAQRQGKLSDYNKEKFLRTFHVEQRWFDTGQGDQYSKNSNDDHSNDEDSPMNGSSKDLTLKDSQISTLLHIEAGLRQDLAGLRADIAEVRKERDEYKRMLEELKKAASSNNIK